MEFEANEFIFIVLIDLLRSMVVTRPIQVKKLYVWLFFITTNSVHPRHSSFIEKVQFICLDFSTYLILIVDVPWTGAVNMDDLTKFLIIQGGVKWNLSR